MFRKLLIATVLGLGLMTPLAMTARADAREPFREREEHRRLEVKYRRGFHHEWRFYGSYHERHEAMRAAEHLRHEGYEVIIDRD